jgi:hypothetical protein
MKRIVSLDFFRGFAMICMLGFHVLIHVSWHAQTSNYTNIGAMIDAGLLPLFVLIFLLANFRALFLLVSMTIHGFILTKSLGKGNDKAILAKNLLFAFMLYLVALFTESIAANWGILGRTIQIGRWAPEAINRVMHFETLNSIAVSIAVLTIVLFLMSKRNILTNPKKAGWILVIASIAIVITHAIVQNLMNAYWPTYYGSYRISADPANNAFCEQYTWNSPGEFFFKLFISAFVGVEQPILPFMATTFIGGIVGILLAQEKVSPALPKKGMLAGLGILLAGAIWLVADFGSFSIDFDVFPPWFYLFTTGLELFLLMLLLRMVEFSKRVALSPKMDSFIKKTTGVRRWGIVSLTLFVWQVFPEFLLRYLGNLVTGGQVEFMQRGQADGLPSIIMIILVIIVWDLLFRLWEKAKFKGTFEWLMASIAAKVLKKSGKGSGDPTERLQLDAVLYHPEPIIFVSNEV